MWDSRFRKCIKVLPFPASPLVTFHPSGDSLVVGHSHSIIEVFSMTDLSKSINKIETERIPDVEWTSVKFSEDGKLIMITTNSLNILIFDSIALQQTDNLLGEEFLLNLTIFHNCFHPASPRLQKST